MKRGNSRGNLNTLPVISLRGAERRGNLCPFTCHSEGVERPKNLGGARGMRRFFASLRMTESEGLAMTV
ncbi:MAG: hypothetical protein MUO97_02425 [Dehalococcoidia bacterium]|nr:hypothetical protein [Dehalococcoidia bacterium]